MTHWTADAVFVLSLWARIAHRYLGPLIFREDPREIVNVLESLAAIASKDPSQGQGLGLIMPGPVTM